MRIFRRRPRVNFTPPSVKPRVKRLLSGYRNRASSEKSAGHRYAPMGVGTRLVGSPRARCGTARLQLFLFIASCISNWFALSGKRYAVRGDLCAAGCLKGVPTPRARVDRSHWIRLILIAPTVLVLADAALGGSCSDIHNVLDRPNRPHICVDVVDVGISQFRVLVVRHEGV
jgi:hypothetical protein